jgi:probable HAF family extracellular repeat protein
LIHARRATAVLLLTAGALPAVAPPAAAAAVPARYTITDLGVLSADPQALSTALAINNAGVVVGNTSTPSGQHAFRWSGGVMTDLGLLPGGGTSTANAINDAGQVAGTADRSNGGYGYPVRWSATGAITDLGGPVVNRLGVGNGIDQRGRVVGGQRPADSEGGPVAMLYQLDGSTTYLGNPPESLDAATAINLLGHVTANPGTVWRDGRLSPLPGLRYFNEDRTSAYAINQRDEVAGAAPVGDAETHAVMWPSATIQDGQPFGGVDIGTIDGIAYSTGRGINASGQVVGTADPLCHPCAAPKAWVWHPGGTITALDTLIPAGSGWQLQQANGINDRGQIVGRGVHDGKYHAFLLTPRFSATVNFQPASAPVPVGYVADSGAVYGPRGGGRVYGWAADDAAATRDRGSAGAIDQRYDTLIHTQRPTAANRWEIAVPNGGYLVHLVAGDPDNNDSVYRFTVEGVASVTGTPTATNRFFERTVAVTVTDGRLTVANGTGASNNKLAYVDVVAL